MSAQTQAVTRTRQFDSGFDVTSYLTVWLVFLFGLSAQQVVGPLGAIGSPALLLLMAAAMWWFAGRVVPDLGIDRSPSLTRAVLLLYGWYLLASSVVVLTRPATDLELTGAGRAVVTTIALVGLALLVSDGITRTDRLVVLLRRVLWGGLFMALIAVLQFFTGESWQIALPGLSWNTEALGAGVESRSIFNRPRGTAMHPIELSVVAAALVPLGVHFSLYSPPGGRRQLAVTATALLGLCVALSLSRSGILALVGALLVMFTGWGWRRRTNGALLLVGSVPLIWMLIPGLVGTIRSLFTWFDEDPSIQARFDRGPKIVAQFRERPWFGLGNGSWSVQDYFLIDNQAYVTTLQTGIVGLVFVVVLFVTAVLTLLNIRHAPGATDEIRHLSRSLAAGITAIGLSVFTFDAFHYRILMGVLFLFIGVSGALVRLTRDPSAAAEPSFDVHRNSRRTRTGRYLPPSVGTGSAAGTG